MRLFAVIGFFLSAVMLAFVVRGAPVPVALSPATNHDSGTLPSGHAWLKFSMIDGDWVETIALPRSPRPGHVVEIHSDAQLESTLDASATDLRLAKLKISTGERYRFTYDGKVGYWRVESESLKRIGANRIAGSELGQAPLAVVEVTDDAWVPSVALPAGIDGATAVIRSAAAQPSRIEGEVLFASTLRLQAGDIYVFAYSKDHRKWLPQLTPERAVAVQAQLGAPTGPRTRVALAESSWLPQISLPAAAGDRDRIVLESSARRPSHIASVAGLDTQLLTLVAGDRYEFMYVAEDKRWVLMVHPTRVLQAGDLPEGQLPSLTAPRIRVSLGDGNHVAMLRLPPEQPPGAEVVVDNGATWPVKVDIGAGTAPGVEQGERITFTTGGDGRWRRSTITVDLMLLYSDKLVAKLGERGIRAYLLEALELTNQALENSGANFRFRERAIRAVSPPANWHALGDVLEGLPGHKQVQQWRNEAHADAIYYVGTEEGCGLAFMRGDADTMLASESHGCGITAMRHELGHAMALDHEVDVGYWQGYALARTIMNGNSVPLYSTPLRFTPDFGLRAGKANKYDAVRALNERSAEVAAFR